MEKEIEETLGLLDASAGSKRVVTNKRDSLNPVVRARLVAIEVKHGAGTVAATHPPEAIRFTTGISSSTKEFAVAFDDVRKTHLNGRARTSTQIKLPPECETTLGKNFQQWPGVFT